MPKQVIFDKKNVLVAGGAGFIGSHLCDELVKECKVICVDNFISGTERNIDHLLANPDFVFINHDLSQPLDLEKLESLKRFKVEFQGIQEIYNLACPMSPKHFLENRPAILLANSLVTRNLLELARRYESRFLQFSSSVVYGLRHDDEPGRKLREQDIGTVDQLADQSAYDEGKRFSETLVANYRSLYQLDARLIRLFRVYGPRMQAADGQMIPDFINSALDGRDVIIHGDENFASSFCYISDVIDAVFKLMNSELAGPVNIGSDVDVKLSDLAALIIRETDSQSSIRYGARELFFRELVLPDIRLAKDELGWMPVVTLENGIKKTIFDIQAHKRLHSFGS